MWICILNKSPPHSPGISQTNLQALPGSSCPGPRSCAEGCPSCQHRPESSLADLEHPSGMAKAKLGHVPRLSRASKALLSRDEAMRETCRATAEGTEGGTLPAALASRKPVSSTICWDLQGSGRPPPGTGGLAVTYLSCSSSGLSTVPTESQTETGHANSSAEPLNTSCSPSCIPRARRQYGRCFF